MLKLIPLLLIAFQDLRERQVNLLSFLLLAICFMADSMITADKFYAAIPGLENLRTLLILGSILTMSVLITAKTSGRAQPVLGMGDILLMVLMSMFFNATSLLLILVISGFTGILHGIYLIRFIKENQIPFCTHLSITASIFILMDRFGYLNFDDSGI